MIVGQEKPDAGKLTVGSTVKLGYMEQSRLALDTDKTVYDVVSGGNETLKLGKREVNARSYVGKFNFTGMDMFNENDDEKPRSNFDDFINSMFTVFQV